MNGFIVGRLMEKWGAQFYEEMPKLVREGAIKYQEDRSIGLDKVGDAFLKVQTGKNTGKVVVIVAEQ
jgi:NADPH-dependent curcumin reductase CurA